MHRFEQLKVSNLYAGLPAIFHSAHQPAVLHNQFLLHANTTVAALIGLHPSELQRRDCIDIFTAQHSALNFQPVAACYAGHQFGQYVPRLGDGRAVLLGQVEQQGQYWDLQLKGAGRTMYSRQGDGKAVLRSTIREHVCSAAMHGLGIPTTHSLALFGSDEPVYREQVETGAMLVRVAPSHIRFGSFEYFFHTRRYTDLATLAAFTLANYFPALQHQPDACLALLSTVIERTAKLIARWQAVGFCHGVMNTDNMSIHSITIDYGPFGFMDQYNAGHICNHSDYSGRYAFDQQPRIALFNLSCLAQALLPVIDGPPQEAVEKATHLLQRYDTLFAGHYARQKRRKLGLRTRRHGDEALYDRLLEMMQDERVDFTILFRRLSAPDPAAARDLFVDRARFERWLQDYRARIAPEWPSDAHRSRAMKRVNPKFVLRNYLAENAIRAASDTRDYSEIEKLVALLRNPFAENRRWEEYARQSPEWSRGLAVSCSS